jgi:dihydroorotase
MIIIQNAEIVNEGQSFRASVWIEGERIKAITTSPVSFSGNEGEVIDAEGLLLLPGVIDDQVHFREPGLTHKGNIRSESRAAVAGGITSFMDMPNTIPQTTSIAALNDKFEIAAHESLANYTFFIGATNDNLDELKKKEMQRAIGIKVFMGSSTGNMLVDNLDTLEKIFSETNKIIAVHCEDEEIIQTNKMRFTKEFGENLDILFHSRIRSSAACFSSSKRAVELAEKHHAYLHLLHLSTDGEMKLLDSKPLKYKKITSEVCIHHLWFSEEDYVRLGNRIKWNPSVKTKADRESLRQALIEGKIDVVATDHAPHQWDEKQGSCLKAASGGPMVQHALPVMLELCKQGVFNKELVVEKMCHAPAELFRLKDRGYIREGYYADLVLVDPHRSWTVTPENILYKCGWSPLEGTTFSHKIVKTFVNGNLVYNQGIFNENIRGKELETI